MTHTGVVRELRGKTALVVVDQSQCGSCSAKSACYGLSGRGPGERVIEADNHAGASVGERVEVELGVHATMTVISVTFIVPVLTMGAGYALLMGRGVTQGAAGAGAGLVAGLLLAWLINRTLSRRQGFGLTVKRVLEQGQAL